MTDKNNTANLYTELQIIPATGWRAVYINPETRETLVKPIACFALIEHIESKHRFIDGMVTSLRDQSFFTPTGSADLEDDYCLAGIIGPNETPEEAIETFQKSVEQDLRNEDFDGNTQGDY